MTEFESAGFVRDRLICYAHDVRWALWLIAKRAAGQRVPTHSINSIKSRISPRRAKELVLRERLAVADGQPSWFYVAFDRGDQDPLTNYALDFIARNIPKSGRLLVTGCGTGITVFHLADCGFRDVTGIDLLPQCIAIANKIKQQGKYVETSFREADCFHPQLEGTFDAITVMHWLCSAWAGNYGNSPVEIGEARRPEVREKLLTDFLAIYAPHLSANGVLIVELIDAVTDYRIASDHHLGDRSLAIYPVRHSPEQVQRCAAANGLQVIEQRLCVSYGHHPRTSYVLKKV